MSTGEVIALIIGTLLTALFGMTQFAMMQTLGRIRDSIRSIQHELTEHKTDDDEVHKEVSWIRRCVDILAFKLNLSLPEKENHN